MKHKWRIFFEKPVEILQGFFIPYLDFETELDTDDVHVIDAIATEALAELPVYPIFPLGNNINPCAISLIRKL